MSATTEAIGLVEVPFLSLALLLADGTAKAAGARLIGCENTGGYEILLRWAGSVSEIDAAVTFAKSEASALHHEIVTAIIPRPAEGWKELLHFPNSINSISGARDQLLPDDFNHDNTMSTTTTEALGILETQGLASILEAADAMVKAANVRIAGKEKIGAAYVTILVRGDLAAVAAAIEAGKQCVESTGGKLIAARVIARPHPSLLALLPE
ncbi:MAG: BMC domain-containing protein [Verrucomicrobiota bacterium]|nr:BMC domain-containing protein [Verrucomicrobiota bacterium]